MAIFRYFKQAFLARPWGMWIPPSCIILAAFGILGFESWGFWLLGAGALLGYLLLLSTNTRFQRVVDAQYSAAKTESSQVTIQQMITRLSPNDQGRYRALEKRCQDLISQQKIHDPGETNTIDVQAQADGLGRLLFVYLKLLLTKSAIARVIESSGDGSGRTIDQKLDIARRQLQSATAPELQKSLRDQMEILEEREKRKAEAKDKITFIEAELTRIQEQVELIREGAVVATDPESLSRRIDTIGGTLGATSQWIRQQQELYGETADLLNDPPPVVLQAK